MPIGALGEQIGLAIDRGSIFQVGAAGSLCVRFERVATPRRLDLHLHWEIEVDGHRREFSTEVVWHSDDYDQEAFCGLAPQKGGELRLVRLSVAIVPDGDRKRAALLTVRDVPIAFVVKDAAPTGSVTMNFHDRVEMSGQAKITGVVTDSIEVQQGNAAAASISSGQASMAGAGTPAADLARRKLEPHHLVPEHRVDWWQRRRFALLCAYSHRALLQWVSPAGPRALIICQQPSRFQLGRAKEGNHFVLRFSPCRKGVDEANVLATQSLSRVHVAVVVTPGQIELQRLGTQTYLPRTSGRPGPGLPGGEVTPVACEPMRHERMALQKSEVVHLGGVRGDGLDGLRLKFTPLANPAHCAVLVERLNNLQNLAYLGMVSATKLPTGGFFQGLPRDLVLECVNGCIELRGPAQADLGTAGIELRDCGDDEFTE
jgi:hypothetical protein